jgi:hypothetical protein
LSSSARDLKRPSQKCPLTLFSLLSSSDGLVDAAHEPADQHQPLAPFGDLFAADLLFGPGQILAPNKR